MPTIPQLPSASVINSADLLVLDQAGTTKSATYNLLLTTLETSLTGVYAPATGSTSIVTLGTIATGIWNATPITMQYGGTGANLTAANGAVLYSTASNLGLVAPGSSGQLFISAGAASPTWTTATFPATAGTSGNVLVSDGTNWSSSATTGITALGAQAQALNMNSHLINNVTDPVSAQDAATKNYVDQTALTGTSVYAASAATLGTVTQSGVGPGATLTNAGAQATFALDSVNPPVNSRVLIKNTATGMAAANEGIYTVTSVGSGASNWVLTRSTDYDTASEVNRTGSIIVQNGSTLSGTLWYNATNIVTVDTTAFNYQQLPHGTVTSIATSNGVTGGTITSTGTVSLASSFSVNGGAPSSSFVMDANGFTTSPKNPSFSAYLTANTAAVTGDGAQYDIISYTSQYDVASNFNAGTGVFTAPIAGTYMFSATILLASLGAGNTYGQAWFNSNSLQGSTQYINWSNWAAQRDTNNTISVTATAIVKMNANDTIKLSIQENNNGAKNVVVAGTPGGTYTKFSGSLVH